MDPELEAIRAKRMSEMKTQQGDMASGMPAGMSQQSQQDQDQQKEAMDERRHAMLTQILSAEARERRFLGIVKEGKAKSVEDMIIRMAQSGQIRGKVSETDLINMLGQISQAGPVSSKIKFNRRREESSDDGEDLGM